MQTIFEEEGFPLDLKATYLAMILGSVGSNQYRKLFVQTPSRTLDVIEDGDLACAYFASSVLTLCGMTIGGVHTTVSATIADLKTSGWSTVRRLKIGAVIIWRPKLCTDNLYHKHIGFYIGKGKAISTNPIKKTPVLHSTTYDGTREIESVYFHEKLKAT